MSDPLYTIQLTYKQIALLESLVENCQATDEDAEIENLDLVGVLAEARRWAELSRPS